MTGDAAAGGVTTSRGFRASGVAAGLKTSGALDVALVVNDGPELSAAAVLTRNRVRAAPVRWTEQVVANGSLRAVVLNSGGANACTGPGGAADTEFGAGRAQGWVRTNDLPSAYVHENSSYSS